MPRSDSRFLSAPDRNGSSLSPSRRRVTSISTCLFPATTRLRNASRFRFRCGTFVDPYRSRARLSNNVRLVDGYRTINWREAGGVSTKGKERHGVGRTYRFLDRGTDVDRPGSGSRVDDPNSSSVTYSTEDVTCASIEVTKGGNVFISRGKIFFSTKRILYVLPQSTSRN